MSEWHVALTTLRMASWLRSIGARIHALSPEPQRLYGPHCMGFHRVETGEIFLAPNPDRFARLMTLAHEGGHFIGQLLTGTLPHEYQRERQAYVYGWRLLRLFEAPITREEWRLDCRSNANGRAP